MVPPKEIDDVWDQGEATCGGLSWVPEDYRVSDQIMSTYATPWGINTTLIKRLNVGFDEIGFRLKGPT